MRFFLIWVRHYATVRALINLKNDVAYFFCCFISKNILIILVCAVLAPAIMQQNVVVSLGLVKFHFKTKLHKNIKCAKTITKLTQIN